MKATLEFNLPEDSSEFEIAARSMNWALVVWDLDSFLRNRIKYDDKEELQEVRDYLTFLLNDKNLSLETIK